MARGRAVPFDERMFHTVAQQLCADGRRWFASETYWQADATTWALWNEVRDGPCFQLVCLHSHLAPEGFGPTLEMALHQLRHIERKNSVWTPVFAKLMGDRKPKEPSRKECIADNLSITETAILNGELRVLPGQDEVEPLLRRADIDDFMPWASSTSLPRVTGWPARPSLPGGTRAETISNVSLDADLPRAHYLLLPRENSAARSVRHIVRVNRDAIRRGKTPNEATITEQLRAAGLGASQVDVKVVSRLLKPDDLKPGPGLVRRGAT